MSGVFRHRFANPGTTKRRVYYPSGASAATYTYAPSGGVNLSGVANLVKGKVFLPSGGISLGGIAVTVPPSSTYIYGPSGGINAAGVAGVAKGRAYAASGGIGPGGVASIIKGKVYVPSGGIQMGGAAVTFPPGFVPPELLYNNRGVKDTGFMMNR